jgi:hypothetical protein
MITAIFVDRKGFKRAEVLPQPVPTYRFPVFKPPNFYEEPDNPLESFISYVGFVRHHKIADDVYEYREV